MAAAEGAVDATSAGNPTHPAEHGHDSLEESPPPRLAPDGAVADEGAAHASLGFLSRAGELLAGSLEYESTLRAVAGLALPYLGSWCIVDLVEPDGALRRLHVVHPDPAKQAHARRLESGWPPDRDDPHGAARVVRTRRGELIARVTDEMLTRIARGEDNLRDLRALGIGSMVVVPLLARNRVLGAITFVSADTGHQYSRLDLELAEDLASRCALALDNARFYAEAQTARETAVQMNERLIISSLREQKLAEEAHDSGARLAQILEAVPVGVFVLAPDGTLQYVNASAQRILGQGATLGIAAGELARVCGAYVAGTDQPYPSERVPSVRALAGEVSSVEDLEIRRPEGTVPLYAQAAPIRDRDGKLAGAVTALLDLSERKHLEEQLRQASKMEAVGRLAGGVAHDFNNMLQAILGNAALLLEEAAGVDSLREGLQEIQRSAERAADLTRQLLAFGRKQLLRPQRLALNETISGLHRLLARTIPADIDLVTTLEAGLWQVMADPTQVEQVILNLAVNARDAMPDGGVLRIATRNLQVGEAERRRHPALRRGDYVELEVSDSGQGMAPETRARIFEPFFTTKGPGKGTGLGLATVYGIVQQSGGEIAVDSALGQGTRVRIYLPRLGERPEHSASTGRGGFEQQPRGGTETVLLVEDEDMVRRLAARILRRAGYTVLEAGNGKEALRTLREHPGRIHLLLTDVIMPEVGGDELAAAVRRSAPDMRILFMSAYTSPVVLQREVGEAARTFIQKPFHPYGLTARVREVLDRE